MKRKTFGHVAIHAAQLAQIQNHDPAKYFEILELITDTLKAILPQTATAPEERFEIADSLAILWQTILTDIPGPGKELPLGQTDYGRISLHRLTRENKLRLICRGINGITISKPLVRWGFDANHISSRDGCWKPVDGAEGRFEEWLREVVE